MTCPECKKKTDYVLVACPECDLLISACSKCGQIEESK